MFAGPVPYAAAPVAIHAPAPVPMVYAAPPMPVTYAAPPAPMAYAARAVPVTAVTSYGPPPIRHR